MRLLLLSLLVIGQLSCSGLLPKRDYIDHTFYATNPAFAIQIADRFKLDEKDTSDTFSFFSYGGESGTNINRESFRFLDMRHQKAFTIEISKLSRGYWRSNLLQWIDHPLEKGAHRAHGLRYQTAIFASKTDSGGCLLVKYQAALTGAGDQTRIETYYLEEIGPALGGYESWTSIDRLNAEQQAFLSDFKEKVATDIQFVDPDHRT